MARAYIAAEKPRYALIIHYGESFPDFIEAFEPARELAYLPDVARLESAWVESYHAAEARLCRWRLSPNFPRERLSGARVSPFTRRLGCCVHHIRPRRYGRRIRATASQPRRPTGSARTRSSRAPTATSRCASCRRSLMISP